MVGLSCATHGKYVHVAQQRQSRAFVSTGEMIAPRVKTPEHDTTEMVYGPLVFAASSEQEAMNAFSSKSSVQTQTCCSHVVVAVARLAVRQKVIVSKKVIS